MKRDGTLRILILIALILFIAVNINGINSFLSFNNDETIAFGHSTAVVPQAWNTTDELNLNNESKTHPALTNGYVIIDHWDDWPEDTITSISEKEFKNMEDGGYEVLKTDNATLSGIPVSKEYFINPSRDNDTVWTPVGANYVFSKEDTNYTIQVHYFTEHDYNNSTFLNEIDNCVANDIEDIHNNDYNSFVSAVWRVFDNAKQNM